MLHIFVLVLCVSISNATSIVLTASSGEITFLGKDFRNLSVDATHFEQEWVFKEISAIKRIKLIQLSPSCFAGVVFVISQNSPKSNSTLCRQDTGNVIDASSRVSVKLTSPVVFLKNLELKFSYTLRCGSCGYNVLVRAGGSSAIRSPNFPKAYHAGCQCVWNVNVDDTNYIIKATFLILQVQAQQNEKCQDFVELYDDDTQRDSKGRFCGSSIPSTIRTSNNHMVVVFNSDDSLEDSGFDLALLTEKKDLLAGLQSVAAILGAISFGIFIGLLLCSVLYKRWSQDRNDNCENDNCENDNCENDNEHNNENDYDDVIQQAAPPSYSTVMATPDAYPTTPVVTPNTTPLTERHASFNVPTTAPPEYPGIVSIAEKHSSIKSTKDGDRSIHVLPPSYNVVSESEDEWQIVAMSPHCAIPIRSNLVGSNGNPPTYEAVTSEGSEAETAFNTCSPKHRSKLKSRTQRSSSSSMYQARRSVITDSDSNSDDDDDGKTHSKPRRKLSAISSSESGPNNAISNYRAISPLNEVEIENVNYETPTIPISGITIPQEQSILISPYTRHSGYSSDRQPRPSVGRLSPNRMRSRSYNDLFRHAIHNSIGKSGFADHIIADTKQGLSHSSHQDITTLQSQLPVAEVHDTQDLSTRSARSHTSM